jgi:thymidylate kinase
MIYILEGPDGTGKSTLAAAIAEKTKGHILHSTFNKDWDIEEYHTEIMEAAIDLNRYQDVVIDRWAPSEFVYGKVFRGKPSYDSSILVEEYFGQHDITWIYCRNDNAVENHLNNKKNRKEMFDDMTKVVEEFDDYVSYTSNNWIKLPWITYDFDKVDIDNFVKEITK